MPTLDDIPTLAPLTPTGDDLLPIFDVTADSSCHVRKVALNQINGLSASDAAAPAVLTNAAAITTRLVINSTGTTALLPLASGVLRDIIIMNGNSASALAVSTVNNTTNIFSSTTPNGAAANSVNIPLSTAGRFFSNGTNWYRVS
jgi:hypothetical protein